MFSVVGLILFELCVCEQLKDIGSKVKVYDERIPNTNYPIFTNQSLTLTYEAYKGVYAMHLRKKHYNESQKVYDVEDYELFQEDAGKNLAENGCVAFQRELNVGPTLSIEVPYSSDDALFFTDLVAVPLYEKVYIVRNDFALFEILLKPSPDDSHIKSITQPGNYTLFKSFLNLTGSSRVEYNHPFLIQDEKSSRVFIVTQFGGCSFDPSQTSLDSEFKFSKEEFKTRNIIHDVHVCQRHKVLFVAAGLEGIDIYKISDGHVFYWKTLSSSDVGQAKEWNVIDVEVNVQSTFLFVLDQNSGLVTLDINSMEGIKLGLLSIPLPRAIAFAHHGHTFFFIAEAYNQEYAVEVFVNTNDGSYYFNRYYEDEMQLNNVIIFPQYAILVGYDAHKLIYHSIYNGFIDRQLEHHTIFSEPELVKVVHYQWDMVSPNHYQLAGLGHSQFKTFRVTQEHPRIQCHSNNELKQVYLLQMNSTNCNTKTAASDHSQFAQCNIHHAFTFEVEQVLLSSRAKIWILIFCIISLILLGSLCWTLVICWQRWGKHISELERQSYELKQKERYGQLQEQNAIQEQEAQEA